MASIVDIDPSQPLDIVCGVQFGLLSPDEIRRRSVVEVVTQEIYNAGEPVAGGVLDTRLGVIDSMHRCPTCGQKQSLCPGHFGHIELAKPVFYVQFLDVVRKVLRCICYRCSTLVLDNRHAIQKALLKLPNEKRFAAVHKLCMKTSKRECPCCKARQPSLVSRDLIVKLTLEWKGDSTDQVVLYPEDVLRMLRRISDDDAELMGFDSTMNRPEWMICTVFPVPPPCVRPTAHNEVGQRREDDLTHKLCDIIKVSNALKVKIDSGTSRKEQDVLGALLQYHVATFADNQITGVPPSQHRNGRPIKSVTERLESKEGRIRGNLMGKRVDFSARSVISPDPNISIDELGVPIRIAMNLTFPEPVYAGNREHLQQLVDNGPAQYPGAKFVHQVGGKTLRLNQDMQRGTVVLQIGDVVDRHLANGDYVLFNRQPSLHKMSMMAHRVRVMPYDTFRLNVSVTTPYNADFDGDEMNSHVPQSLQTAVELKELAAVPLQVLSPRESKPIVSIVQDVALGVFRMSQPHVRIDKRHAFNILAGISTFTGKLHNGGDADTWNGKDVLSYVIPSGLNLRRGDVEICDGRILSGVLSENVYAGKGHNLIQTAFKEHGPDATRRLLDDTQRVICEWLCGAGFSMGISDLVVSDDVRSKMHEVMLEKKRQLDVVYDSVHNGTFVNDTIVGDQEHFENLVKALLQEMSDQMSRMLPTDLLTNRLVNMVKVHGAGSKGSSLNMQQMMAQVGQQSVEEDRRRVPYSFAGRTLPHFTKYDDREQARGFVQHSFLEGLSPHEFFFHAMGGREGLIDTAVRTSDTGYIQRKLVKAMEDCKVAFDLTVRTVNDVVVQFLYGGDGFDPCKLEHQEYPPLSMSPAALYDEYTLSDGADAVFRASLLPSAYDNLVANVDESQQIFLARYERVVQDLRDFCRSCSRDTQLTPRGSISVYFPVNFERILINARHKFSLDGKRRVLPSDLDVLEALRVVDEMVASTQIMKGRPNPMFGILARAWLNPMHMVSKYGIGRAAFAFVIECVRRDFMRAIQHPGENVGIVGAQSIGEPSTQVTLNSFHTSGVATASRSLLGVPRLVELLSVTQSIKTPQLNIRLQPAVAADHALCQQVLNEIETTYIRDIVSETSIFYDRSDSVGDDDDEFMRTWREFNKLVGCANTDAVGTSPWMVHMTVDRGRLLEKGLNMYDLHAAITRSTDCHCVYSDDNAAKLVLRMRIDDKARDALFDVRQAEQQLLNLPIKGLPGINAVIKRREKFRVLSPAGTGPMFELREEFILNTDGSNLMGVLGNPQVDPYTTMSNDVVEIYNVLGIEAARTALILEIKGTLVDLVVQDRHIELLVDVMSQRGSLMSVSRHGLFRQDIGPLAKASFEQSAKKLIQAGVFADQDKMNGLSAQIMLGQLPIGGTGDTHILMDPAKLAAAPAVRVDDASVADTDVRVRDELELRERLDLMDSDFTPTGGFLAITIVLE